MSPVGLMSYGSEARRRIAESPLNSPAMQSLRAKMGIKPVGGYSTSPLDGHTDFGYTGLEKDLSRGFNPMESPSDGLGEFDSPPVSEHVGGQRGETNTTSQGLTYEELRARNRGLIK